ncbi:uncharacterized protein LOC144113402 isoform X4 [Amblyomma americanum]
MAGRWHLEKDLFVVRLFHWLSLSCLQQLSSQAADWCVARAPLPSGRRPPSSRVGERCGTWQNAKECTAGEDGVPPSRENLGNLGEFGNVNLVDTLLMLVRRQGRRTVEMCINLTFCIKLGQGQACRAWPTTRSVFAYCCTISKRHHSTPYDFSGCIRGTGGGTLPGLTGRVCKLQSPSILKGVAVAMFSTSSQNQPHV